MFAKLTVPLLFLLLGTPALADHVADLKLASRHQWRTIGSVTYDLKPLFYDGKSGIVERRPNLQGWSVLRLYFHERVSTNSVTAGTQPPRVWSGRLIPPTILVKNFPGAISLKFGTPMVGFFFSNPTERADFKAPDGQLHQLRVVDYGRVIAQPRR